VEHDVLEGRSLIPQKRRDAIVDGLGLGNESLLPGIRGKKPERRIRGFASEFFIALEGRPLFSERPICPDMKRKGPARVAIGCEGTGLAMPDTLTVRFFMNSSARECDCLVEDMAYCW